ncbi:hypothetical protein LAZ67_1005454 [Cordylochernes scorpioides]|uniref:Reverse transcriptase domain-containing protein n=1 Tax=Cordylochernes scorpioides TaxID=51811 RepID=A0ABY6K1R6_9ARAC|nr:hypothetical protein LAZ67_1005454 [Cordylochernes scorpioides]
MASPGINQQLQLTETILEHKQRELTALIAVDLSGAFDNAWWPAIINRMDLDNVPSSLIQIIQSFLNNKRTVCLSYGGKTVSKNLTKGCPQGSPLSPLLWNILLNDILMNFKSTNAEIICYADDISIICWHYNLEGLKTELVNTLNYVTQWCRSNKLKINPGKTNLIHFHNFHRFQLEFQKTVIKPSNEIKILGMKLSNHRFRTKINFTPHINEILHKAHRMKNLLFSLSGKIWDINSNKRLILYKTLIRPILTYGAEIWFYQINNRCKQKLNSTQYQIVLWATRSFKTSSSNCVHCLAEIPFLTDFIESRLIKYELDQLSEEDQRTFSPHSPSIINGFLRTRMEDMFSNTSDHFRLFYPLGIPKYFRPDFYNVQSVTGHGNFGDFLFRIGAIDDPGCLCGKRKQDSSHLLLECPIFQNYRNRENIEYKDLFMFVNRKDSYFKFRKFLRPFIERFQFPGSLQEGQRFSVLCSVTRGDRPVEIRWSKDGRPLGDPGVRAVAVAEFSSSLVFEAVRPHHRGNYTCRASNRAGSVAHSASMVIHEHPAYSPDLAPSDYFLFGLLKKELKGKRFDSDEDVQKVVQDFFHTLPKSAYKEGIYKLPERWRRCIESQSDYFE